MSSVASTGGLSVGSLLKQALRHLTRIPPITPGELDPKELPELIGKPDPVILDIGCNDGASTLAFLNVFKQARIFCFEPDPRARRRFQANVNDPRAQLYSMAVGAVDGAVTFYPSGGIPGPDWVKNPPEGWTHSEWNKLLPEGWDYSGSIRKPKNHLEVHPWCTFDDEVQVQMTRLDSWTQTQKIDCVDFIWADVQGAEADLIEGARETLKRTRFLYTEYSNQELYEGQADLKRILKMLPDFRIVRRFEQDVLLRHKRLR